MLDRRCRRLTLLSLLLLSGFTGKTQAAQVMDEVWFPAGRINFGMTQTTPEIARGICDTIRYFETRTPIDFTELPGFSGEGGLTPTEELGALEIRYSEGTFNYGYGGQTKHYRKPNQGNKRVKLSFENVKTRVSARTTLGHEMGHVLGFTHEFQRWDRRENGIKVKAFKGRDPYNYGRPDKKNVRVLTPYDHESRFASGYQGVTPTPGTPDSSLLSQHDINAIYRVYAQPLGELADGVRFGEAVASGDFDGDGFDDLAVAARYSSPEAGTGAVYFYRGVAQAPGEEGTGTTYIPWFTRLIGFVDAPRRIVLAVGDTHTLVSRGGVMEEEPSADGIDELIVGLPGAGRVEIWIVNAPLRYTNDRFNCGGELLDTEDNYQPWGGHGVARALAINAGDFGLSAASDFGAALATGRFFNRNGDDLAIGVPGTSMVADKRTDLDDISTSRVPQRGRSGTKADLSEAGKRPVAGSSQLDRVPDARKKPTGTASTGTPAGASTANATGTGARRSAPLMPVQAGLSPTVLLLPDAGVAGAASIPDPTGEGGSEFGAALAVLEGFDGRHDTLVVGAPGAVVMDQPGSGKVFVYGKSYIARADKDTPVLPELVAEYPAPGTAYRPGTVKGERLGEAVLGFTTREEDMPQDEYWLAVGTPEKSEDGTRCGGVELFRVELATGLRREADLSPPTCEAGMKFGDSLALSHGKCDGALCPRDRAWIAVGSPRENDGSGRVRLWNVWENGEAGQKIADTWRGATADALFGKQLASVRGREKGGGFLVSSKRGELPLVSPQGAVSQVQSGYVQVHLNTQGVSEWTSWVRGYSPASSADTPPDNR